MKPYYETWWFEWLFIGCLCACGWMIWQVLDHPFLESGMENSDFMELAKALAAGKGYTLLHTGNDLPYLNHPPLYPLILAGVMKIYDQTDLIKLIHPFKVLNLWMYLTSVVLVYYYFRRNIRKPYPFVITALYGLSPLTLSVAGSITSEMTYMVLSMLALISIDKFFADKGPSVTKWQLAFCLFWIIAAIFTRNIGFALLGAFFLLALKSMGIKRAFVVLGIVLACIAPWFLREIYYRNYYPTQSTAGISQEVSQVSNLPNPFSSPSRYFTQVFNNGEATLRDTTQNTLGTLSFERFDAMIIRKLNLDDMELRFSDLTWARWTLGILVALGLLVGIKQFSGIGSLYLAVFILCTSLVMVEKQARYLLPVLPFIYFYLYMGVMRLGEWMAQVKLPVSKLLVPIFTLIIGFNSLNGHLENLREARLIQAYYRPETLQSEQKGYLRALQWIRSNTPPTVEIIARKPSAAYVYTERKSRLYPQKKDLNATITDLRHSDYILEELGVRAMRHYLSPAVEKHPEFFRLVYNDPASQIRIWRVLSGG